MDIKLLNPIDQEWLEQEWLSDLEQQWRESQPRFTDRQLLDIFSEIKPELPKFIDAREIEDRNLQIRIGSQITAIYNEYKELGDRIIARETLKTGLGQDMYSNRKQLSRLRRLQNLASGDTGKKGGVSDQDIKAALDVPIETLFEGRLRKTGKTLTGLCPFHQEKHSSFYIYPATNSYYCFGCNCGGNSINFTINLNGLNFVSAVKFLTNT